MRQEHLEEIKSYYDGKGEYKANSRYSGEQGIVYTKPDDKYHWLVIEQKGADSVEVHQTDGSGRIIARDTFESVGNTVKCTGVSRKMADSRVMVQFCPEEISLICQFGGENRHGTVEMLRAAEKEMPERSKRAVSSTIHKLSVLSEDSCMELISSIKNRKKPGAAVL